MVDEMFEVPFASTFKYRFHTACPITGFFISFCGGNVGERTFQTVTPQFRDNRVFRIDVAIRQYTGKVIVVPQPQSRPVQKTI